MTIPTYVPISEASRRTGADPVQIHRLANSGVIRAARLGDGSIIVAMEDLSDVVKRADFSALDGVAIHISEAARKYGLQNASVSRWVKAGHIRIVGREKNRVLINEADIAFIKAVISALGLKPGQPLAYILGKVEN